MRGRFASEYALAESGLQGFAPTGSPGLDSLGCGLVVCLRSIRFRLATDTLPFSATVRIQLDRQVFHPRENSTAGHTSTNCSWSSLARRSPRRTAYQVRHTL